MFELNYNSILEFTESEQLDKNIIMGIFVNFRKFWGQNANKQKFPKEPYKWRHIWIRRIKYYLIKLIKR